MRRSGLQHLPFTPRRAPALRSERVLERKTTTYAGGAQQFGKSRRACARRGANTTHRTLMLFYNTNPRPLAISPWTALRLSQRRECSLRAKLVLACRTFALRSGRPVS